MTITVNWKPCSADRYDDMLGCVPPRTMEKWGFLVGEPYDHRLCEVEGRVVPTYQAFVDMGEDRFYEADRPLTLAEFLNSNLPD